VHIVGGAGAGKSTLAHRIGACLGAPIYHLDDLNFVDATGRARPEGERAAEVERIAAEPAWVTDGIFLGWTDVLLQTADRVIWLDLPWYVALPRIVQRYIRSSVRGTNRYRGLGRLYRFLRWSAAYYRPMTPAQVDALNEEDPHSRAATARHLGPYANKLLRCSNATEVADLVARLQATGICAPAGAGRPDHRERR
jgi:hypothetical protein